MNKKWLYSVAVGTLLMAGEALGITIHDVLSNGFWSAQQRGTYEYLDKATGHNAKYVSLKNTTKQRADGSREQISIWTAKGPKIDGIKWKGKFWCNEIGHSNGLERSTSTKGKLTAIRNKTHKEKTRTYEQKNLKGILLPSGWFTNVVINSSATYTVKPLKKGARPMGPLAVDDWFPDSIYGKRNLDSQFYGTEETAVTNIVSDQEAYITRVVEQTGYLDAYRRCPINEEASLLRTYNTHITTDEDHVYVDQTICENTINNPDYNQQDAYQTQYVATFKKGQWKNSTETITHTSNQQMADWYFNYLTQDQEQTTRISSQQPDHRPLNQR